MGDIGKFTVEGLDASEKKVKSDDYISKMMEKDMKKGGKIEVDFKTRQSVETVKKALGEKKKMENKSQEKLDKEQEEVRKNELDRKIMEYLTRDVKEFKFLQTSNLPKLAPRHTVDESQFLYNLIIGKLNGKNGPANILSTFKQGCVVTQAVWKDGSTMPVPEPMKMDLHNLGDIAATGVFDEGLDGIINEIDIEYPWFGQAGLFRRTLQSIAGLLLSVHQFNKNPNNALAQKLAQLKTLEEPIELKKQM